jgi:hypothetical protein
MKSDIERRRRARNERAWSRPIKARAFGGASMIATKKFLASRQCLAALALISFLVLATTTSYAETITVIGADGAPGMPGSDAVATAAEDGLQE